MSVRRVLALRLAPLYICQGADTSCVPLDSLLSSSLPVVGDENVGKTAAIVTLVTNAFPNKTQDSGAFTANPRQTNVFDTLADPLVMAVCFLL